EVAHFLTRQFPNLEGLVTLFSDQARYVRFGTESSFPGLKYLLNTWAPTLQTLSLYGSLQEDEGLSLTDEINKLTSIKRLAFRGCIQLADLGALAPILPQLEFFSMDLVVQKSTLLRALPHLNSCTHLNFNARISGQCVVRWAQVNPALVSRV